MKRILWTIALAASVTVGCGDTDAALDGGAGGSGGAGGGVIGPLTWTGSTLTIVGDECEFFVEEEVLTLEITIQGSTVIMSDADPISSLEATTDSYSPEDDQVLLTGSLINDDFPPCKVDLDDAFTLLLNDPNSSLDQNQTVQVTWDHVETDVSDTVGDCQGVWFADLPCAGEVTFTLTQQTETP